MYIINSENTIHTTEAAGLDEDNVIYVSVLDGEYAGIKSWSYLNGHTPFSALVAFSGIM